MKQHPLTNHDTLARLRTLLTLDNAREWQDAKGKGFVFATAVMMNRVGLWFDRTPHISPNYVEVKFRAILAAAPPAHRGVSFWA